MTPEETKKAIAVMQHYADGGEAEYTSQGDDNWLLVKNPGWDWDNYDYRIKSHKPEVGKWYTIPFTSGYIKQKCIAFEFGTYVFLNEILVSNYYTINFDFSDFKEVQP